MPRRVAAAAVAAAALAACGGGDGGDEATTVRVFAAASLTEAFTELGVAFEAEHPDVDVAFTFGGSSSLARQLRDGADADVFASADEETIERDELFSVHNVRVIARNRLAIVVEEGNPRQIKGLADLATPGTVVVLCAPEVPCGRLADAALTRAGVRVEPSSLEEDVKAVVSRVALGEADAGIAYATDVLAAGDEVDGVDVEGADDPALQAVYPMGNTGRATDTAPTHAWMQFVLSPEGQRVLAAHGFLPP